MSANIPGSIPAAMLETILTQLAAFFLLVAGEDITAARQAAFGMLAAYNAETVDELRLAANIVSFGFQTLDALAQAARPDMPINRVIRLRSGAVSLSRESHKAQRRLDQLQKARRQGIPAPPAKVRLKPVQPEPAQSEPARPAPASEKAVALIQHTKKIADFAKASGLTWTQAYNQRQRDLRLAARQQRADAIAMAQCNGATAGRDKAASSRTSSAA